MVHKFTEEQKRRFTEQAQRHYERFHTGALEGTPCNADADCAMTERAEYAEQTKVGKLPCTTVEPSM